MLTREMFMLPEVLRDSHASGVLDTPERVREARGEYLGIIEPAIFEINQSWRAGMETYARNPVRFAV